MEDYIQAIVKSVKEVGREVGFLWHFPLLLH